MSFLVWSDGLSVGVNELDNDHKKLVELVNRMHDALSEGKARTTVGPLLDDLIRYTRSHFEHEERFFARTGYPHTTEHKAEHDKLTHTVLDLQKRFHGGASSMLSLETMSFLKHWLVDHIQGSDKKYGPYLNGKGIH